MDRFIDVLHQLLVLYVFYLKSNMDRFIATTQPSTGSGGERFKIQYG